MRPSRKRQTLKFWYIKDFEILQVFWIFLAYYLRSFQDISNKNIQNSTISTWAPDSSLNLNPLHRPKNLQRKEEFAAKKTKLFNFKLEHSISFSFFGCCCFWFALDIFRSLAYQIFWPSSSVQLFSLSHSLTLAFFIIVHLPKLFLGEEWSKKKSWKK